MMENRELIRMAMACAGLATQAELAECIGVGHRTVAGWSCGQSAIPGPARKLMLMLALGHATARYMAMLATPEALSAAAAVDGQPHRYACVDCPPWPDATIDTPPTP